MNIDLSILSSVDFTNRDTLIFFAIILFFIIGVLLIIFLIINSLIKAIKKIFIRTFDVDVQRSEFVHNREIKDLRNKEKNNIVENVPRPGIIGSEFIKTEKEEETAIKPEDINKEKGQKSIEEGLSNLKSHGAVPVPTRIFTGNISFSESSPVQPNEGKISTLSQKIAEGFAKVSGPSMFGDKPEISRRELSYKLRKDTGIWKDAKKVGLNLSPLERSKLVQQVFSKVYGANISKSDLKQSIRKLNQKMTSTKDLKEHAKLRKEIKFFKKIGGL